MIPFPKWALFQGQECSYALLLLLQTDIYIIITFCLPLSWRGVLVKGDSAPSLLGFLLLWEPWGGAGSSNMVRSGVMLGGVCCCCRKERKDGAMQDTAYCLFPGVLAPPLGKYGIFTQLWFSIWSEPSVSFCPLCCGKVADDICVLYIPSRAGGWGTVTVYDSSREWRVFKLWILLVGLLSYPVCLIPLIIPSGDYFESWGQTSRTSYPLS